MTLPKRSAKLFLFPNPVQSTGLPSFLDSFCAMISDGDLYRLAVLLGSTSMVLIVLYHFLEINSDGSSDKVEAAKGAPLKTQDAN